MPKLHAAFYAFLCVTIASLPLPASSASMAPTAVPTAGVARFVAGSEPETKASACRHDVCHNDGRSVAVVTGAQLLSLMLTQDVPISPATAAMPRLDADTDAVLDLFEVRREARTTGAEMLSYFLAHAAPKTTGAEMLSYFLANSEPISPAIPAMPRLDADTDAVLDLFEVRREARTTGAEMLSYFLAHAEPNAQEQAPVTGSEMLSHFLAQEQAPVTGSEMLSYFLAQEQAPVTGSEMLSHFLAQEQLPVTGSEMLSYFLAQEGTRPATGSELLRYLLKQEAVRTITGVEMLSFMLNDPDFLAPTATPTLSPRHASGKQILEYFAAYSDYEEIWSDASAERGKPLVDYLLRHQDTAISGSQIIELLGKHDSISEPQRRRLQTVIANGDFVVTGQVVLDYLTTVEGMAVKGSAIEGGISVGDAAPPQVMAAPLRDLYEVWSKDRKRISDCMVHHGPAAACPSQLNAMIELARNHETVIGDGVESICANSAAARLAVCSKDRWSFGGRVSSVMQHSL